MSYFRGETTGDGVRLCRCGCGQVAKRFVSDGRFKAWRGYARGHAPNERLVVTVPTDPLDLAYAAGILDGEGCIYARVYIGKGGLSTLIQVAVTMCSEVVVKWLHDSFGGQVCSQAPPSAKRRLRFTWQIRGRHVTPVLPALLPYLKEKRRRAELAIELASLIKGRPISRDEGEHRKALAAQIKAFNRNPRSEDYVQ